jgi:TctA family transporter
MGRARSSGTAAAVKPPAVTARVRLLLELIRAVCSCFVTSYMPDRASVRTLQGSAFVCVCVHVCAYMCVCVYVYMCVCVCAYMCASIDTHM